MKCINCETEIPPNWVACIQKNICPACGESILDSTGEELLKELTDAMERMPNDPAGLAGWIISNFHIRKIGSLDPVDEFYGRKKKSASSSNDGVNEHFKKIWNNSKVTPKTKSELKSKIEEDISSVLDSQYGSEDLEVSSDEEEYFEDDSYYEDENPLDTFNKDLFSVSGSEPDPRISKLLKQEAGKPKFTGAFSRK